MNSPSGRIEKLTAGLALLWRYGVVAFLLAWCVLAVVMYLVVRDRPVPISPPDGYVAEEVRVSLYWSEDEATPVHDVEVAEGRDFSAPVFSKPVQGATVLLPKLKPDTNYCWRLKGNPSKISCFRTGRNSITY
jgi:hypothetical protein